MHVHEVAVQTLRPIRAEWDVPFKRLTPGPREVLRGEERDEARLIVLDRHSGAIREGLFRDLPAFLAPGDALVVNVSRAIHADLLARLPNRRHRRVRLVSPLDDRHWAAFIQFAEDLKVGDVLIAGHGALTLSLVECSEAPGRPRLWRVALAYDGSLEHVLATIGQPVQSPYVSQLWPIEYYNPVYARIPGSSEGASAGRHFTQRLLAEVRSRGIHIVETVLHIGLSSLPIMEDHLEDHQMLDEPYTVSEDAALTLNRVRAAGGRIVAVGTSPTRALETVATADGRIAPGIGRTDLYIFPGYRFRAIDGLITNFHPWASTRLVLAMAFAGAAHLQQAYRYATDRNFMYYEFGDTMLIL